MPTAVRNTKTTVSSFSVFVGWRRLVQRQTTPCSHAQCTHAHTQWNFRSASKLKWFYWGNEIEVSRNKTEFGLTDDAFNALVKPILVSIIDSSVFVSSGKPNAVNSMTNITRVLLHDYVLQSTVLNAAHPYTTASNSERNSQLNTAPTPSVNEIECADKKKIRQIFVATTRFCTSLVSLTARYT